MAGACLQISGKPTALTFFRSNHHRGLSSYRPMKVIMLNSQSYWESINADIEAHLKQSIPIRPPLVVFEPMRHLALAAPTTTAPALCIAACELLGGSRDQAMAAASALHLIHASLFTHEHLPLTDRPMTKPKPKHGIHHSFGPNIELLTGDGLVPFGFELLARSDDQKYDNSERILRVIIEISRASGSMGMIDGYYRQTVSDELDNDKSCHLRWIEHVARKKEGELHACSAACGAILGVGSEDEIEKLRKYGLYVGMIQGMLYGVVGTKEKGLIQRVEELKELALKEVKDFDKAKIGALSSLVEANFCYT